MAPNETAGEGPTAAKTASPAPAAVIAWKQRRLSVESGDVAATDAVATMVAVIIIAARRVAPSRVRVTIAIVVIVVPGRGSGGDYVREQSVPVYRPPVLSTRNPSNAEWGRRSAGPRLGALDPQRDAALFRPAEREQCHTCDGRGCDCSFFQSHLHGFSPSLHAPL
jgi:hypothetical protein